MPIYFYSTRESYGEFSNFSAHGVTLDGKYYRTTEHYFQSQKYAGVNPERAALIRQVSSPKEAANLGRDRKYPLRPDWEQVKDDVMRAAVRAKFSQHVDLGQLLLATAEEELVEASSSDYYWGCGTNGDGKNMLGQILMEVRAELRAQEKGTPK